MEIYIWTFIADTMNFDFPYNNCILFYIMENVWQILISLNFANPYVVWMIFSRNGLPNFASLDLRLATDVFYFSKTKNT